MDYIATILLLGAALGMGRLALVYLSGPVPAEYHRKIIDQDGGVVGEALTDVLRAVYRFLGAALLSLALLAALVGWQTHGAAAPVWRLGFLVSVAPLCLVAMIVPYGVERRRGVRTPWRAALALSVLLVLSTVAGLV